MKINYIHEKSIHDPKDALEVLPILQSMFSISSVVDVGCGNGSWLKACQALGITDYWGLDGVDLSGREYLADPDRFTLTDLTNPTPIDREFDLAFCLEVGEHLPEKSADVLVEFLCRSANKVVFSAACPGQRGQGHINCQWPEYWAQKFRSHGYQCDDSVRFLLWENERIESYYRQNMFIASNSGSSGVSSNSLLPIIHPDMLRRIDTEYSPSSQKLRAILNGDFSGRDYLRMASKFVERRLGFNHKNGSV